MAATAADEVAATAADGAAATAADGVTTLAADRTTEADGAVMKQIKSPQIRYGGDHRSSTRDPSSGRGRPGVRRGRVSGSPLEVTSFGGDS